MKYFLRYRHSPKTFRTTLVYICMSRRMGKPTICICENKAEDQLRSNCEAHVRIQTIFSRGGGGSKFPEGFGRKISTWQKLIIRQFQGNPDPLFPPLDPPMKLISAFVFATRIVQFLYYLNPIFPASSHLLCLYRSVYVGPDRKPHC